FFTNYYLEKNPTGLLKNLKWLQNSKFLDENESAVEPTAAFLSAVFSENPKMIRQIATCTTFTGKAKDMVEMALWLSGNSEQIRPIFDEEPDFARSPSPGLKKRPIKEPGDLDMMWGAFLASGDVSYVNRIIDVLDKKFPLSGADDADKATRMAAE